MKLSIRSFVFVSVLTVGGSTALAVGPVQWTAGNGHWYEAVSVYPGSISWTAAEAAAEAKGGYLATITSKAEDDFVFSLVSSDPKYWYLGGGPNSSGPWLGARQTDNLAEPAGHWAWVTGEPFTYTDWAPGSPNNYYPNEDYLHYLGINGARTEVWDDAEVNGHVATNDLVASYIIEYNTPEPASLSILGLGVAVLFRRRVRR